ncbi:unnamed protein product [Anisakis simplex]|uniref:Zf-C2H2_jaz domain-containing protein n=1 Tax=Anisakis simplex TaxID=6269 RepID=A0A0M3KK78_ANISI|nr:unnamed protein product [Anisakis simplex]
METKLANGKSTSNGHMSPVWRPDLWLRDVCLVCQSAYQTDEQKTEHIASDVHIKVFFISKVLFLARSV